MSFLYFCRRIKSVGKSRTNTISKDHLKNLVPFTEEWLAVMEAFGEVSLLASWTFWACQVVIYMSRLSCVLHNCLFLFYLYGPSPVFLGEVELGLCPEINFMICNMNCHLIGLPEVYLAVQVWLSLLLWGLYLSLRMFWQEVLEQKTGAVQNSPTDKAAPEPSPWSPVCLSEI